MSQLRDQMATIKKWEDFFANGDVGIAFEDVIVCLANVGLLQLQLESPTTMGNPHLIRLENILEEMYRDVGCMLQCQNLTFEKRDSSAAASRPEMLELNLEDKVLAGKLQCIVNTVELTLAGSTEASTKFHNSSFLYFLQMIDDLIVRCPWRVKPVTSPSLSSCAFVYECPQVSTDLAYRFVDEFEMKKSISTLITIENLIGIEVGPGSNSNLSHNETEKMQDLPRPPSEMWTTDLIMEDIFKRLTAKECLRLRSVNKQFNHFAVKTLLRHHSDQLKIHFEYDLETNEFFCPKLIRGIYHKLKLADLTHTIQHNSRFPCGNFSFVKGTIASPDIQGFLDAHGKRVKMLHLNLHCEPEYIFTSNTGKPPVTQFLTLLTRQATHLQILSLESFPKKWITYPWFYPTNDEYFPPSENVKLKNLHSLQFGTIPPKNLVKEFLTVALNLKNVSTVYDLSPFIQMNKFHLLQDLIWEIRTEDNFVEHYIALNAQFKPNSISNLRTLGFYIPKFYAIMDAPSSLTDLITKILESSANSLQKFHIMGHMGFFRSLRFPVLPKVKELRFSSRPVYTLAHQSVYDPITIFPPAGFSTARIFPALQKIRIGFICIKKMDLNWNSCFGNCFDNSPLVTVKCLEIQEFRDLPPGWLENLAVVCPCVEFIDIKTILYNFPEDAVKGLWNFKKLKSLKLKIHVWEAENAFPAIDRVFTGFSNETCLELFNGNDQVDIESLGGLRVHSSLLDLKELTRLQLTFVDVALPRINRKNPIITQITGRYAFAMCPQLKVCIEAEGRTPELSLQLMQDLEPLYPFVHLHIPNNLPSEHFKPRPHPAVLQGNFYNASMTCYSCVEA